MTVRELRAELARFSASEDEQVYLDDYTVVTGVRRVPLGYLDVATIHLISASGEDDEA